MDILRFRLFTYLLLSLLGIAIFTIILHVQLNGFISQPLSGFPNVFVFSVSAATLIVPVLLLIQSLRPLSRLFIPVVEVAWVLIGSALYVAGTFVILFINVPLLCNNPKTLRTSEARNPSACVEFNAARFLWWINTGIFIVAFVVVTTWSLIQSARGSPRVWSTSFMELQMRNTKNISVPVEQRRSFYLTTSSRMSPHLGQPQLAAAPRSVPRQQGADPLYPAGPPRAAPRPGTLGEFNRAKNVSIGAGYVRANDPSAALRDIGRSGYAHVPASDPNLPEDSPDDDAAVGSPPVQGTAKPPMRPNFPPSAFSNLKSSPSQGSVTSMRSYPYPFPAIPPSQPPSRAPSTLLSLRDQPPLQTQPPDRIYPPAPLQYRQTPNGSLAYDPVPTPAAEELFRTRGNKNRQTTGTVFSLSPYYADQGEGGEDDAVSIASRYSTTKTITKVKPNRPGTTSSPISSPPISPLLPLPLLPPGGPPTLPMRSPRRQSSTGSASGQQGPAHPLSLGRIGRGGNERPMRTIQY